MRILPSQKIAGRLLLLMGAATISVGTRAVSAHASPLQHVTANQVVPETVQYIDGDGPIAPISRQELQRQYRAMDRYGENYHPDHPGHAGLYDCGPGGKNTRLSRKACGGNNRFAHIERNWYD